MSKYFQDVFDKLCPAGRGTLSIKTDNPDDEVNTWIESQKKKVVLIHDFKNRYITYVISFGENILVKDR